MGADDMRQQEEERLLKFCEAAAARPETAELAKTVHELMARRVELELQNGELRETRAELEFNAGFLAELYDCAPVGYFSISANGMIRQLNFMGAEMLGRERALLLGARIVDFMAAGSRAHFNAFLGRVFAGETAEPCEVVFPHDGKAPMIAQITGILSPNGRVCRMAAMDVTGQRQAEAAAREKNEDLDRIFNLSQDS